MRINKWHIAAIIVLVSFFGYLAYNAFIFDDTASAKNEIQQEIAAMPVTEIKKSAEYYGHKRAEIALQEYSKDVTEVPRGCNCGPEIDKYTEGNPGQWCTMFASWVANQSGSPLFDIHTKSWRFSNSRLFTENLKQNGVFYTREDITKNNLKPRIGDFVVFWRGNLEDNLGHIDVVVAINKNGTAGLVGGNVRDRVVYRENFPYLDYYGFLGFGRPEKN
jgi:hypothetical protein